MFGQQIEYAVEPFERVHALGRVEMSPAEHRHGGDVPVGELHEPRVFFLHGVGPLVRVVVAAVEKVLDLQGS